MLTTTAELREGEPCPECQKIVRFPLSHACDANRIDCSVVNDVGHVEVRLGNVSYRMTRRQFVDMVRGAQATPPEDRLTEAPMAWMVFTPDDPAGCDYYVYADVADANRLAADSDEKPIPLYRQAALGVSPQRCSICLADSGNWSACTANGCPHKGHAEPQLGERKT